MIWSESRPTSAAWNTIRGVTPTPARAQRRAYAPHQGGGSNGLTRLENPLPPCGGWGAYALRFARWADSGINAFGRYVASS